MKKTTILATLAVLGLGLGIVGDSVAQRSPAPVPGRLGQVRPNMERHPEIRKAIHAMMNAKKFLAQGARDFGGHRAKAAQLIDAAIEQAKQALNADKH